MQFFYVAVLVAILIGGYQYFTWDKSATDNTESTTETQIESEAEKMTENEDMNMSDEEMDHEQMSDEEHEAMEKVFNVGGTNFEFDVKEMKVKEGDTVTINFVSNEGFHDWVVDEFDAATEQVRPGAPTSVTFVADKAGTYEYYCSVGSHRANGMVGTLIVE